jgi:hypothetical protein
VPVAEGQDFKILGMAMLNDEGGVLLLRAKFWRGWSKKISSAQLWHDFCTKQFTSVELSSP